MNDFKKAAIAFVIGVPIVQIIHYAANWNAWHTIRGYPEFAPYILCYAADGLWFGILIAILLLTAEYIIEKINLEVRP